MLKLLGKISDEIVTHRKVSGFNSTVVPHPLYPVDNEIVAVERDVEYLYFGAVKRYKGINELLRSWPSEKKLLMVGECSDKDYENELIEIINNRKLMVEWINKFVDYEDLNYMIGRAKFVLLPHNDNAMYVSGAFFHAASLGANILARDGEFFTQYMSKFSFTHVMDYNDLNGILERVDVVPGSAVMAEVRNILSDEMLDRAWGKVIFADKI